MTISATGRRYEYSGDGSTTAFSFPRPFTTNADIKVYLVVTATNVATLQTIVTHYSLTGAGNPAGGTVTFGVAPASTQKVVIFADTDATQGLDLDAVTSWPMTSIEAAFDRVTVMVQEVWDRLERTPSAPRQRIGTFDYTLPVTIASKLLGINNAANGFELRDATGAMWLTGSGAPGAGLGVTGDMYLDTSTGDIYGPKSVGWGGIVGNIRGPTGASGAGTGDVIGPASSTDDRVALFNGATGKIIKQASVLISELATVASPTFTGTPAAPTAAPGTDTTQIATTSFVKAAIDVVKGGVSSAFDTLSEIATELALKATIASPTFTGDPKAPTASPGDNDTSIATTAFVTAAVAASAGVPPGSMVDYAAASPPSGWLSCDGAAVSRTTYAALFAVIATTWGAGDGSTTFNVPDFRGRAAVGAGTGTVSETQAAANFNTSDTITVNSNTHPNQKWVTGHIVQVTTTGVLPTGISALTDYFVRRTGATTIELYDTLANALNHNSVSGRVDITATGSGNHTITRTHTARSVGQTGGVEGNGDIVAHKHTGPSAQSSTNGTSSGGNGGSNGSGTTGLIEQLTAMPPFGVALKIIKT
jgi:microcystin-dependent protein